MTRLRTRLSVQPLEARDCPAADLRAEIVRIKVPDIAVPGDPGLVTFRIYNVGDAPATGTTGFHLYMSADTTKDDNDWLFGKVANKTLNLAAPKPGQAEGGSVTYTALVEIPRLLLPDPILPEGSYYILAEADSGERIGENAEDNNVADSGGTFDYQFWFGDVGDRKGVGLVAEGGGGRIDFDLIGGGTGKLAVAGGLADLTLENTTKTGTAKAVGVGAAILRNVTAPAALRQVIMPRILANGVLTFAGLEGLVLNQLGGQASSRLDIGTGAGKPARLAFKAVADVDMDIRSGVKLLSVGEWLDSAVGGRDELTAPYVRDLLVGPATGGATGNFEADLTINQNGPNGYGLTKVAVAGKLRDAIWTVGGTEVDVKDIYAGAAEDWRLTASGHVGKLVIGTNLTHSDPFADTLYARTFGTIKVAGDVNAGNIVAAGAGDPKTNIAIKELDVQTVTGLSRLTAAAGGIHRVKLGTWVAQSLIEAKWVGFFESNPKHKDLVGFGSTRADFKLTGRRPGQGEYSLGEVNLPGLLVDSNWDVTANVGTVKIGVGATRWVFRGDQGTDSPRTRIDKLHIDGGIGESQLTFSGGADSIRLADMSESSSITTTGRIDEFTFTTTGTESNGFQESTLEAGSFGRLTVRNVQVPFTTTVATIKTRRVDTYTRWQGENRVVGPKPLTDPGTPDSADTTDPTFPTPCYQIQILPPV